MLGPTFWSHSNKYSLIPHCGEDFSLYDLKNNVEYFFHVYMYIFMYKFRIYFVYICMYVNMYIFFYIFFCVYSLHFNCFFLPWGEPLPYKLFLPWKILFYDNATISYMNDSFWLFCDLLQLQVYAHMPKVKFCWTK